MNMNEKEKKIFLGKDQNLCLYKRYNLFFIIIYLLLIFKIIN